MPRNFCPVARLPCSPVALLFLFLLLLLETTIKIRIQTRSAPARVANATQQHG